MESYTIPELKPILKCSYNTIRKLITENKLLAIKHGRSWVVTKQDLDIYINNSRQSRLQKVQARKDDTCQSTCETVFGGFMLQTQTAKELDALLAPPMKNRH